MSETATKKKEPGMATLVIVLFAICAATALLLGLTNYVTAPFIAANNEKTTQEAMAAVLPADSYDEVEYTGGDAMVQAVYKAGDAGYVVEVKPATSFSGNLTIMVGVDNTGACSGISITSTGETSGLGSKATDPDWQELHEKLNASIIGHGPTFCKFTGSRGKYGANDAHPEYIGWLRGVLNRKNIPWQMAELGKVDHGGGGTVALYLAAYGMDTIDLGPAVLSMHSPFELLSKADLYSTKLAYQAILEA